MYTICERKYYMKTTLVYAYLFITSIICIIVPVVFIDGICIYATLSLISLLIFYLIAGDTEILYCAPVFSRYYTAWALHKGIDKLQSKRKRPEKVIDTIFRERRTTRHRIE